MEDACSIAETCQVKVSRLVDTSTTTQVAQNHGPALKTPVVPLERNLCGHPLPGLLFCDSLSVFFIIKKKK